MSKKIRTLKSEKSGDDSDYMVVATLPSHFRSYDVNEVMVRGLFYCESLSLSKYVGGNTSSFSQLAAIYSDVIRGIDIYDLEIVDFIILTIISSIWTIDDFGWKPNIRCANMLDDGNQCKGIINELIILDDFEFNDPLINELPIPVSIRNKDMLIGAITVKDAIDKERYLQENPDEDSKIIDYSLLLKNEDMSFEDRVKFVKYSKAVELRDMSTVDSEIHITINTIKKTCPSCRHVNKLKIGLETIRGYP